MRFSSGQHNINTSCWQRCLKIKSFERITQIQFVLWHSQLGQRDGLFLGGQHGAHHLCVRVLCVCRDNVCMCVSVYVCVSVQVR
jgi:hypothetical protein